MTQHFLADDNLSPHQQREVLELALHMRHDRYGAKPFAGPCTVAIMFDKPSTRTRISFATGVAELGGFPLLVDASTSQMSRGESIADTARVLERQVAMVVWRTFEQSRIEELAAHSSVPVVNALTDMYHPCQVLADLAAVSDARGGVGALAGLTLSYVGDGANNMAHSYLLGGANAGMHVRIGAPADFSPDTEVVARAKQVAQQTGGSVTVTTSHDDAVAGADVIATDTWVSMGDEGGGRERSLAPFQVNGRSLDLAAPDVQVLHCLPAYRGKEITAEVMDGDHSIVWLEAEYRLHAQKALMAWLVQS